MLKKGFGFQRSSSTQPRPDARKLPVRNCLYREPDQGTGSTGKPSAPVVVGGPQHGERKAPLRFERRADAAVDLESGIQDWVILNSRTTTREGSRFAGSVESGSQH